MKFFKWFKSSAKIKRWIFLILVGITLVCYGMSKVLVTNELEFNDLVKIVATFTLGFTFTVIGIICIQKRTLELLVEESDTRDLEKGKNNVNSLIFNKRVYNQGPKVVVIGGGSGLNTVLRGLKNYTDNITAIVTVSDYGDSKSGDTDAMDNIKDSLIALSNNEEKMSKLLNSKLALNSKTIKFSELYFGAIQNVDGDFTKSIEDSKNVLNMIGRVLPVTLDPVKICAELDDGTIVESKNRIPEVVNEKITKINRIFLSPTNCKVAPGVIEAIEEADEIVIGPGSLYTNVIPNLLVAGVSRAIKESKAFKIYVSNIMTEFGQTDNFSLSDHIKTIIDHAGEGIIDYCIYDTGEVMPEYIRKYNKLGCELVEQDVSVAKSFGVKLIQRNLSMIEDGQVKHNPDAVATTIIQLLCEDLKFKDMENNAQFMMLESKVKDTNKKIKKDLKNKQQNIEKDKKKAKKGHKASKFFEKYNDRITSIKESEYKAKNRTKAKATKQKKNDSNPAINERIAKDAELLERANLMRAKLENSKKELDAQKKPITRKANTDKKETKKTNNKEKNILHDEDFKNILNKMIK